MGNIVVSSMISLDGYTEGAGGNVMAMPMDHAFSQNNVERVREAGSLLFGGTTYRGMLQYWPGQVDNPDATPDDRYIAQRYADGIPITVVSDSLTVEETGSFREQTTIVPRAEAYEAVARLRERDGNALIFGSRTLWADLLTHGLVDELYLMIAPSVVAGDQHAFHGVPSTNLRLRDVRRWDGSDVVSLTYTTKA